MSESQDVLFGDVLKTIPGCDNPTAIREDEIVDAIRKILLEKVFTASAIAKNLKELQKNMEKNSGKNERELADLKRRLSALENKCLKMMEELAAGELPRGIVKSALQKFELKKVGVVSRIEAIEEEINQVKNLKVSSADVEFFSELARKKLESEGEELRATFARFGVRVEIGNGTGIIKITPVIPNGGAITFSAGSPPWAPIVFLKHTVPIVNKPGCPAIL